MRNNTKKILYYLYQQPDYEVQILNIHIKKHNYYVHVLDDYYTETKTFGRKELDDICDSLLLDGIELNDLYDNTYQDVLDTIESCNKQ